MSETFYHLFYSHGYYPAASEDYQASFKTRDEVIENIEARLTGQSPYEDLLRDGYFWIMESSGTEVSFQIYRKDS